MKKVLFLIISILVFQKVCLAQDETTSTENRFKAGFKIGFNASQINGDFNAGYNKVGLFGGINALANLSPKAYFQTGIYFSQRGSTPSLRTSADSWKIRLNFVEIPLTYHIKDWETEDGFYRMHFGAGFNYSRLLSARAIFVPGFTGNEEYFASNNFNWLIEATFYTNKHLGFGVKYSRAINKLYKHTFPLPNTTFTEHWITFNTALMF